jgi:hypothetical protein
MRNKVVGIQLCVTCGMAVDAAEWGSGVYHAAV